MKAKKKNKKVSKYYHGGKTGAKKKYYAGGKVKFLKGDKPLKAFYESEYKDNRNGCS